MPADIRARVVLDGAAQVKAGLKDIGQTGESAFGKIAAANGAMAQGGAKYNQQLKNLGLHALQAKKGAESFREAIHIAHPVLDAAGLGIGNLGAFARLANVGLVGLTAAIAGAFTLGLARLGDTAKKTGASLDTAFGTVLGPEAHAQIRKQADELGVTSEAIAAAVVPLQEAQRLRGGVTLPAGRQITAAATFEQLNQLNAGAPGEGLEAAKGLFGGFAEQGRAHPLQPQFLNADMLAKLPPGIAEALAGGLGAGNSAALTTQISAGRRVSLDETLKAINEGIGGDVQGRYGKITPQQQTLTGGLNQIWNRLNERLGPVGTAISTGAFQAGNFLDRPLPGFGGGAPKVDAGPAGEWFRQLTDTSAKLSEAQRRAVEATNKFREAQDRAAESFAKQEIEQKLRGSRLGEQQAALDLKYERPEAQARLAHDELGVESARLGVEGAGLNSSQAQLNLRKLLVQRAARQGEDIDPDELDALQRRQENLNISRAGLEVRQTDIALRSAKLEESDTSLRFSKGEEGQPISHGLQQLKYDETQTRYLEDIATNTARTAAKLEVGGGVPPGAPRVPEGALSPSPSTSFSTGDLPSGRAGAQQHVIDIRVNGQSIGTVGNDNDAHISDLVSAAVNEKLDQILPRQSAAQ
jgi:hypothetical protein